MTDLVIWAALVAAGIAIGAGADRHWHPHRIDAHEYRRVRLEATRVDRLYNDYDHEARHRHRLETELDELRADVRVWVGDLLDKVAARDRTIARLTAPRHRRPSPIPPYGNQQAAS